MYFYKAFKPSPVAEKGGVPLSGAGDFLLAQIVTNLLSSEKAPAPQGEMSLSRRMKYSLLSSDRRTPHLTEKDIRLCLMSSTC